MFVGGEGLGGGEVKEFEYPLPRDCELRSLVEEYVDYLQSVFYCVSKLVLRLYFLCTPLEDPPQGILPSVIYFCWLLVNRIKKFFSNTFHCAFQIQSSFLSSLNFMTLSPTFQFSPSPMSISVSGLVEGENPRLTIEIRAVVLFQSRHHTLSGPFLGNSVCHQPASLI